MYAILQCIHYFSGRKFGDGYDPAWTAIEAPGIQKGSRGMVLNVNQAFVELCSKGSGHDLLDASRCRYGQSTLGLLPARNGDHSRRPSENHHRQQRNRTDSVYITCACSRTLLSLLCRCVNQPQYRAAIRSKADFRS